MKHSTELKKRMPLLLSWWPAYKTKKWNDKLVDWRDMPSGLFWRKDVWKIKVWKPGAVVWRWITPFRAVHRLSASTSHICNHIGICKWAAKIILRLHHLIMKKGSNPNQRHFVYNWPNIGVSEQDFHSLSFVSFHEPQTLTLSKSLGICLQHIQYKCIFMIICSSCHKREVKA